jgi:MRG-binding protein
LKLDRVSKAFILQAKPRYSLHTYHDEMPPRKRARVSAASTPLHETQPNKAPPTTSEASDKPAEKTSAPQPALDVLNDPWTDDEETQLFKAIIKWKPTGTQMR